MSRTEKPALASAEPPSKVAGSRAGGAEQASKSGLFAKASSWVAEYSCKRARQDSNLDVPREKIGSSIH